MPRPRILDRESVNELAISLKVSQAFRTKLARLVELRAAELYALTGQRITLTASAVLRWLVEREWEARETTAPEPSHARRVRPKTRPKKQRRIAP
jgi:hypothetical protein